MDIKVKASYCFWKHPIKYHKERKVRKILELMLLKDANK